MQSPPRMPGTLLYSINSFNYPFLYFMLLLADFLFILFLCLFLTYLPVYLKMQAHWLIIGLPICKKQEISCPLVVACGRIWCDSFLLTCTFWTPSDPFSGWFNVLSRVHSASPEQLMEMHHEQANPKNAVVSAVLPHCRLDSSLSSIFLQYRNRQVTDLAEVECFGIVKGLK